VPCEKKPVPLFYISMWAYSSYKVIHPIQDHGSLIMVRLAISAFLV
jgi:hypothetical protein